MRTSLLEILSRRETGAGGHTQGGDTQGGGRHRHSQTLSPVTEGYDFSPEKVVEGEKYGHTVGMFTERAVRGVLHGNASRAMTAMVANATNNSLAAGTWKSYKPVIGHIAQCQEFIEQDFEDTPSRKDAVTFVAYLAAEKGLKAATIGKYLSAWRMLLIAVDKDPGNLRPSVVRQTLRGLDHLEKLGGKREVRQVVTPKVLELLRMLLMKKNSNKWTKRKREMLWCGALLSFWGAFRGGEIFPKCSK